MSYYGKADFNTKYANTSSGTFKPGQSRGIGSAAMRSLMDDMRDSILWVENFIDDDTMATATASTISSSESIVAYIASQIVSGWPLTGSATLTGNVSIGGGIDYDLDLGTSGDPLGNFQLNATTAYFPVLFGAGGNVFEISYAESGTSRQGLFFYDDGFFGIFPRFGGFDTSTGAETYLNFTSGALQLLGSDGGGSSVVFQISDIESDSGAIFTDNRTTKRGICYGGDYSAGFQTRSLVDKGYVDGIFVFNGGTTTLTDDVNIEGNTSAYSYYLGTSGDPLAYLESNSDGGYYFVAGSFFDIDCTTDFRFFTDNTNDSDGKFSLTTLKSSTNTVAQGIRIYRRSSGTAANGIGTQIVMGVQNAAGTERQLSIQHILADATNAAEDSTFKIRGYVGGTLADRLNFDFATIAANSYTPSNVTTDRTYDANSTDVAELADVLGTLIADLQAIGIIS